jgi:hypothetical protein
LSHWQHRLLIDWKEESLPTIIKLANLKRRDLHHDAQIKNTELECFKQIKELPNFDRIHWEDMLNLKSYIENIKELSSKYQLKLDYNLVKKLWNNWNTQTKKILEHE